MLCPKCKTEISQTAIRCTNCGVKVRSKCPSCGLLNKVNALTCSKCNSELLRKCSSCGAYNLPTAKRCRKCQTSLIIRNQVLSKSNKELILKELEMKQQASIGQTLQTQQVLQNDVNQQVEQVEHNENIEQRSKVTKKNETLEMEEKEFVSIPFSEQEISNSYVVEKNQKEVKSLAVSALMNSEYIFTSMISNEGNGKSHLLNKIKEDLLSANIKVLSMEATPVTQLSPYGVFQDLFLTSMGLANYFVDGQQKESDFIKNIEQGLGLTSDDACIMFNLLYPVKTDKYEQILYNRDIIKNLIKKIFFNLKNSGEIVLTIDDFDLIDASSFELLVDLFNEKIIGDNFKLFVTARNQRNIDAFIMFAQLSEEKCDKYYLGKMSNDEIKSVAKHLLNDYEPFTDTFSAQIVQASNGSPAYIEQLMLYMNEVGLFNFDGEKLECLVDEETFTLPVDTQAILNKRLDKLKQENELAFKSLTLAAMLGVKFNIIMVQAVLNMDENATQELIQQLVASAFIQQVDTYWFKFTNSLIWKYLFEYVKQNEDFAQSAKALFDMIEKLRLTNIAYKPLLAQNAKAQDLAFIYWTNVMKNAAYIGDVNLYVLAQKQCLKLNEDLSLPNKQIIDINIRYRLGKLLCEKEPELAYDFLTTILNVDYENNDVIDFVDTSANAIIAANKSGNYNAVIEIVDKVVNVLTPAEKYKLEIALINTRKIKTMFLLGSYEHLINIIENEINPQLEDALSQNYTVFNLPISKIFETWIETNLILAESLLLQGNNRAYDVIASLEEALSAHEPISKYNLAITFTKAFASAIKGDVIEAEKSLEQIEDMQKTEQLDDELICKINLLQVMIRFLKKDFSNMKKYLFETVTFANNNNDYLGKNLLKSALGKLLEGEGDFSKAQEIYNDQITYFAKERIALGALLNWYFLADICLKIFDVDKALEIALNALDVAKNPKINSYYFQVMYKRLIAEIYLIKGDCSVAKMYLEKAMLITKKYNLEYLNIQLYDFYAKYHIEMFKSGKDGGSSPLVSAKKLYEKAITLASKLGLLNLVDELKKEYQSLLTFAQLKKVVLN